MFDHLVTLSILFISSWTASGRISLHFRGFVSIWMIFYFFHFHLFLHLHFQISLASFFLAVYLFLFAPSASYSGLCIYRYKWGSPSVLFYFFPVFSWSFSFTVITRHYNEWYFSRLIYWLVFWSCIVYSFRVFCTRVSGRTYMLHSFHSSLSLLKLLLWFNLFCLFYFLILVSSLRRLLLY